MHYLLPDVLADLSGVTCSVACVIAAAVTVLVKSAQPSKLDAFPTVGSSGWFGSWGGGLRYFTKETDIVDEGYKKHKPAPFKVARMYGWTVVLSKHEHLEEVRKAPEDVLSFTEAMDEQFNFRYILGDGINDNPYHLSFIRSRLTRNIGSMYPEIRNEIVTAFDDILDLRGDERECVPILGLIQKVVSRTSNMVFVGPPLCRNPEWNDLVIQYSLDFAKTSDKLKLFPKLLRPLAIRFFTAVARGSMRAAKLLSPIVEERLEQMNSHENTRDDFLSLLIEEAKGPELTVQFLTDRVLHLNFAAVHSFTHVLLYLAAHPQYIQPLREEVEAIVEKEGWSKTALDKMCKVDSFLRECQRLEGLGPLTMQREAMKDFRFSDGKVIPKGTSIGVAKRCLHHDAQIYARPDVFEPFRFADMQQGDVEGGKHQFVATSVEYQAFGYGKHACPGRFFAANTMKTMLAHIVTTYDIELEGGPGAGLPRSLRLANVNLPDPRVKMAFRRRID